MIAKKKNDHYWLDEAYTPYNSSGDTKSQTGQYNGKYDCYPSVKSTYIRMKMDTCYSLPELRISICLVCDVSL